MKGHMYDSSIFPIMIKFTDDNTTVTVDKSENLPQGRAFIIVASNVAQAVAKQE